MTDSIQKGCNVPDIDVVVQWKLPATLSHWIQRAGRAARGQGRTGLAVLLVEPAAFRYDPSSPPPTIAQQSPSPQGKKSNPRQRRTRAQVSGSAADVKAYALAHGLKRGGTAGNDDLPAGAQPALNLEASDEGLLAFVQSTHCRRKVWREMFENDDTTGKTHLHMNRNTRLICILVRIIVSTLLRYL